MNITQAAKDFINKLPWYDRIQFQILIDYRMFPGGFMSVKKWLFDPSYQFEWNNNGRYWLSGAIRILGLDIGAGAAYQRKFK